MFYLRRRDGKDITPAEMLKLSNGLNDCEGSVKIPDWGIDIPDVRETLGDVLVMPYNVKTIGIPQNGVPGNEGPYRRNMVIATILRADYEITSMPHESWTHDRVIKFMGLGEEELGECRIYIPPVGGNRIKSNKVKKHTSWEPNL